MTERHTVAPFPTPGERPTDLPDLVGRLARRDPDVVAVHERTPEGLVAVTRGELWQRVRALTEELREHGVGAGDAVAVWMPNWTDALVWQCAVAACGGLVVGINTRYGVEEVTHVLARARPVLMALAHGFHGLDLAGKLRVAVEGSGVRPQVALVRGDGTTPDVGDLEAWTPERTDGPEPGPSDPDRLAVAFTTSGSTGLPKLAAHTGAAVLTHAVAGAAALGLAEGDVVLGALPLSGVFGYNAVMAALAAGGAALLEPVFDADDTLDDMAAVGVTHLASGDDLVLRLVTALRDRPRALPMWRWWGVADFQGRSHELAAWLDDHGVETAGVYGSSELFALAATWPLSEPTPQRWAGGGRVVHPGIEVRVQGGPGVEGELEFRGPNVVDAYLGSAPETFTDDGWFRSGDLGVVVDEGAFVYVCRAGDALRLRGFLVDPAEIELRLAAHPAVHTAKVVGAEGPDGGSVAVGFVTLDAPAEPSELRDWCAATLAAFKVPVAVHVLDEMPTTSGTNGTKIRTSMLAALAREQKRS
ncbi:AMP-binding protein [Actinomycetospora corticicola]|uniref:Fatty-acyl-CoA synthase n=1 Tax=Actinomycetospora corticicola TaxID=663602 RepID=A0A7Y9E1U7_9PSEU|nr:AMP-binding protein [Actinomycetospora corticicola]NYD39618.1 fatty-acyl-CoA synthase [Actinomycetospora corticicola]